MDTERLAGRKALITGAAQGMGAAIAHNWAQQGAAVCVGLPNRRKICKSRACYGQAYCMV